MYKYRLAEGFILYNAIWEEKLTGASSQKQSCTPLHSSTWFKWLNLVLQIDWNFSHTMTETFLSEDSPQHSVGKRYLLAHHVPPPLGKWLPARCQWAMTSWQRQQWATANCQRQSRLPNLDRPPSLNYVADRWRTFHCYSVFSSGGRIWLESIRELIADRLGNGVRG